mmetsp:Transcript_17942/g.40751  ORF Transcript_17942/g.40751 Transcript_17942/m.40751 type:complete len:208 (-) Transcript_17942:166-789(-)
MLRHETPHSGDGTVLPQPHHLASVLHPIIFQRLQRDALAASLHLLRLGVHLFLPLLSSSAETEDQVERGLLLDVVVGEGAPVLQLFAGENEALLVRRDSLLVLDFGLDVVDGVRRFHVEGDGLARQGLDENLHGGKRSSATRDERVRHTRTIGEQSVHNRCTIGAQSVNNRTGRRRAPYSGGREGGDRSLEMALLGGGGVVASVGDL